MYSSPPFELELLRSICERQGVSPEDADLEAVQGFLDATAVTLKLRLTGGDKLKLMMMRGTGMLGRLGGGETQQEGVQALAGWFTQAEPPG